MDKLTQECIRSLLAQIRELRRVTWGNDYASNDELDSIEAKCDALIEDENEPPKNHEREG